MSMSNPVRPKVRAAAQGGSGATADEEEDLGRHVVDVGGAISTAVGTYAAFVKRDGLRGAWQRLVHGERPPA